MTLDFRAWLALQMPLSVWCSLQFWVCWCAVLGFLWQLAYDGKFAVEKSFGNRASRFGVVVQITVALGGLGDSFVAQDARPLFVLYVMGTLLIQAPLYARWVYAGRPPMLH